MPHRDEFAICPTCQSALDSRGSRLVCDACGGSFVTESELAEMLREMEPDDRRSLHQRIHDVKVSELRCPRCAAAMTDVSIDGIPVDRCVAHGLWFDRGRLEKTLAPDADAARFTAENAARQDAADRFEFGTFGSLLRSIVREWRRRRTP